MQFELTGTRNFRSLKGLPTLDGRYIADHTILRSDQLDLLVAPDWALLQRLGVKTVCDLRSASERTRHPSNLPIQGLRQLAMEMISDVRADPTLTISLKRNRNAQGANDLMLEVYRRLPGALAPHLPMLFALFETAEVPVLIHCAAGKDRTGFAVAVLLYALGVKLENIFSDYLLSARAECVTNSERRKMIAELVLQLVDQADSEAMIDTIMDARPVYLQTAFDSVVAQYGSMDAYLKICAGLDTADLHRFRDRWLTATPVY